MSPSGPVVRQRFDAAVFDMDGLLIDSEPLWHAAEIRIFGRYGVPLTAERCRETKGMFVGEVTRHWYARYPWTGPTPDAVAVEVIDAMASLLGAEVSLKRGACHALDFCRRRGLSLALASSSPRALIDVVVERLDLGGWFAVVHSAEDEPAGKPHPAVFLTTAALLATSPERCIVFEDSPAGVAAAAAAGMVCVAVPEEWVPSSAEGAPDPFDAADLVIESLEDLDDEVWFRLTRSTRTPGPP